MNNPVMLYKEGQTTVTHSLYAGNLNDLIQYIVVDETEVNYYLSDGWFSTPDLVAEPVQKKTKKAVE